MLVPLTTEGERKPRLHMAREKREGELGDRTGDCPTIRKDTSESAPGCLSLRHTCLRGQPACSGGDQQMPLLLR